MTETETFLIQCPEADAADFDQLVDELVESGAISPSDKPDVVRVHPFDGQVLLEMVLPITTAVLAVVRMWIRARYDQKKSYFVMKDGDIVTIAGYEPDKALEILNQCIQQPDDE
jgi:hypothetical protein